jgi:HPt (histidine-containing phosphotransfer) domain-containing protein
MKELRSDAWLSLEEAARRLGVSRLRLREGIAAGVIEARRDNRGFWSVPMQDPDDARDRISTARVTPEQLLELLFDDVEEATAALAERDADIERLSAVVERQQALIEQALRLAEGAGSSEAPAAVKLAQLSERSHALLERALSGLEARDADLSVTTGMLGRALDVAARLEAEVARHAEIGLRQRVLLDRVFAVAESTLDRMATNGSGWLRRWRRLRDKD